MLSNIRSHVETAVTQVIAAWAPAATLNPIRRNCTRSSDPSSLPRSTHVAVLVTARFALRSPIIDREHVYAALSAYVLGGLLFALLHLIVGVTWPGSYVDAAAGGDPTAFELPTAIYFSFVTLATLGYGDVIPRTEVARGLVIFEAVAGQLYIAVTIARLVSAQRAR